MNTDTGLDRRAAAWLADGPTELADRVLDAALREVHLTKQRRAMRVPWRFPLMPGFTRATAVAAVALVAAVGVGGLLYVNSTSPGGPTGTPAPTPSATAAPASTFPPGITGWTSYASEAYGFGLGFPDDWTLESAATRRWQAGDRFPSDVLPYADIFVSPEEGDEQIALFVWEMPRGETVGNGEDSGLIERGPDVESVDGLKLWAQKFCVDVGLSSCEEFPQRATPMCLYTGECRAAILVPTTEQQYAFFVNWSTAILTSNPDRVRVVVIARDDGFPQAAEYGGSVELLKSILTKMNVWTPGQQPAE